MQHSTGGAPSGFQMSNPNSPISYQTFLPPSQASAEWVKTCFEKQALQLSQPKQTRSLSLTFPPGGCAAARRTWCGSPTYTRSPSTHTISAWGSIAEAIAAGKACQGWETGGRLVGLQRKPSLLCGFALYLHRYIPIQGECCRQSPCPVRCDAASCFQLPYHPYRDLAPLLDFARFPRAELGCIYSHLRTPSSRRWGPRVHPWAIVIMVRRTTPEIGPQPRTSRALSSPKPMTRLWVERTSVGPSRSGSRNMARIRMTRHPGHRRCGCCVVVVVVSISVPSPPHPPLLEPCPWSSITFPVLFLLSFCCSRGPIPLLYFTSPPLYSPIFTVTVRFSSQRNGSILPGIQ